MCAVCFTAAQVVPLGALYARAKLVSVRDRRAIEDVQAEAEAALASAPEPTDGARSAAR
jgi:hypothetical protein